MSIRIDKRREMSLLHRPLPCRYSSEKTTRRGRGSSSGDEVEAGCPTPLLALTAPTSSSSRQISAPLLRRFLLLPGRRCLLLLPRTVDPLPRMRLRRMPSRREEMQFCISSLLHKQTASLDACSVGEHFGHAQ
jgi:hypothetical protein